MSRLNLGHGEDKRNLTIATRYLELIEFVKESSVWPLLVAIEEEHFFFFGMKVRQFSDDKRYLSMLHLQSVGMPVYIDSQTICRTGEDLSSKTEL